MPKAARAVIDTMRQNYLSTPYSAAETPKKANVKAAFFTKAEIQAFLRQLARGEDVMVHLVALDNGNISLAMVGHSQGRDMGIQSSTGAVKGGITGATAVEGIYSDSPCPPRCKEIDSIFLVN